MTMGRGPDLEGPLRRLCEVRSRTRSGDNSAPLITYNPNLNLTHWHSMWTMVSTYFRSVDSASKVNLMRDGTTKKLYETMMRRMSVGDISQGEILTDLGLAAQFNTSRTPVREACIYLVKEGFLRRALGRGYIVTRSRSMTFVNSTSCD